MALEVSSTKKFTDNKNVCSVFNNCIQHVVKSLEEGSQIDAVTLKNNKCHGVNIFLQTRDQSVPLSNINDHNGEESEKNFNKEKCLFKGKILKNETVHVEDYGLKEKCVINVINRTKKMEIQVETLDGRLILIEASKTDKMTHFMSKIQEKIRFDKNHHIFECNGKLLDYKDDIIEVFEMVNGGVIKIVRRMENGLLIYVRIMKEKKVLLEVLKGDTCLDIKKKLKTKFGLPVDDQILIFNEIKTVEELKISEWSTIDVEIKKINIFVKISENKTPLEIVKNGTILDLKIQIEEKIKMKVKKQKLTYKGHVLLDADTTDMYGIVEKSVIKVENISELLIVEKLDRKLINLEIVKNDTIFDIKKMIEEKIELSVEEQILYFQGDVLNNNNMTVEEYNIVQKSIITVSARLRGGMQISVKKINGEIVPLELLKSDLVRDIKIKIEESIKLKADEYKLVYEGKILRDEKTVEECGLGEESVINIENIMLLTMTCKWILGDTTFSLKLPIDDRILDMRKKIEYETRVSTSDYRIWYQEMLLEDDYKSLEDYNIANMAMIRLVKRERDEIQVHIKNTNKEMISVEVSKMNKISDIKKKIRENIFLSSKKQKWLFNKRLLEDDSKTVDDYKINHKSVINIVEIFRIAIRNIKGNDFPLEVEDSDIVLDVKKKIQEKIKIKIKDQSLKIKGHILKDDHIKVCDYNIVEGSDIHLTVISKMTIHLFLDNTETVFLDILNIDTIYDVKKKIEDKLGLPAKDQILVHQDIVVKDGDLALDSIDLMKDFEFRVIFEYNKIRNQGICLIINNEKFSTGLRSGTMIDEENIKKTFQPLGYEIKVHRNIISGDLNEIITETKKSVQSSDKMLIVFVLSHGSKKGIMTRDGKIIPFKNIWAPFNYKDFEKLANKPKLFFFSCCRISFTNESLDVLNNLKIESENVIPREDFFFGFATCKECKARRTPKDGTLYIKTLCQVVKEHPFWSISDIHQEIQTLFVNINLNIVNDEDRQMPYCENMLSKHAQFSCVGE